MSQPKPSLQRHIRKNSQPSPTSPAFPRRHHDRPRYSDPFSPVDTPSATTTSSDSPSIDVHIPSSSFDQGYATAGAEAAAKSAWHRSAGPRLSDDATNRRPPMLASVGRPFTSDAVNTHNQQYSPDSTLQDPALRPLPAANSPRFLAAARSSSEFSPRYVEGPSPVLRGYSPQMSNREFRDDPAKLQAQKRSRLNLLNPMSLLARRRTSQNPAEASDLTINTMHVPAMPENFNPSIRGTITHDFSAPRSRRTPSSTDLDGLQSASTETFTLTPSMQRTHSPAFREHFQDDSRALRPEQTAYLHHAAGHAAFKDSNLEHKLPAFAKKLPSKVPEQNLGDPAFLNHDNSNRPLPQAPISPPPPIPPPKNTPPLPPPQPQKPPPLPPSEAKQTPATPPREAQTPSPPLRIPSASKLPKHMTSTSSRFSFQIASSTQEKLLEEKHKQYQAKDRGSVLSHGHGVDEDNFDDYDFDADAGMEDEIPEFNVDDYDGNDGFDQDEVPFDRSKIEISTSTSRQPQHPQWAAVEDDGFNTDDTHYDRSKIENMTSTKPDPIQSFHFTPESLTFSPTSPNNMSQSTPRDDARMAIGVADTRDALTKPYGHRRSQSAASLDETTEYFDGLGIKTSDDALRERPVNRVSGKVHFDDADMYFDDGEFGNDIPDHDTGEPFDEDTLDNENAVRDIPAENLRRYESAKNKAGAEGKVKVQEIAPEAEPRSSTFNFQEPSRYRGSSVSVVAGLTEDNLAAYHDMLAHAANEAAANGKFNRVSFSQDSEDESQPGIISSEQSRNSNNFGASGIAYDDGFPFDDDDMFDETMIAAANAEALENDDDGFYGQEHGFYARARNKDESDMVNGGFFAPRGSGSNGIKRSHSGRANFQEPSLTPITERSEWSTRNSVASLQIPGGIPQSATSLPSPGIAQLLERDSPVHDDDMTLSALMKLRRGAFGGSSSSVGSLTGPMHNSIGSPLAQNHAHPFPAHHDNSHMRSSSSAHSILEADDEDDYLGVEERTMTQNTPMKKPSEPYQPGTPSGSDGRAMSPTFGLTSAGSKKSNHSRASSGAESVSYSREADGRWVLERRRTGEMEVEREYLDAARI
ncbi:uncharacterized protein AB675_6364 [Cyphellophora attinorum]|uniref:Uncharacterized protein n=1 Tax=Cyphellophora attinorum TaxID=1664694 RepID=A0A0N1P2T0_9EURO|nr:uncharacterized protein AB675_6364 [Phialophora attinorum]KPI44144.1 hypothetical protein AB675_6364 [Phialophora attinorum]